MTAININRDKAGSYLWMLWQVKKDGNKRKDAANYYEANKKEGNKNAEKSK